jgi:uncharacterized protein
MTVECDLKTLATDLIDSQSTMTLATAAGDRAWAAPVYYVFFEAAFYFFSVPESRHIEEASASMQAAAAIHPSVASWKDIRGIQMSGSIRRVRPGLKALNAVRAYVDKYPFTKEFFDPGLELDLAGFGRRFRVRLYRFDPALVYYLDNGIRFGFREIVEL